MFTPLDRQELLYHLNATLFHIVHACGMPAGAAYSVAAILRRHGVSIDA